MSAAHEERLQLSVVIPTIGREDALASTLACLLKQRLQQWECLIINQGPPLTMGLPTHHGRTSRVRVIHCTEPNASLARNVGLLNSRAEVVLFLDDDLVIESIGFLDAHLGHYADSLSSGVFGQVLNPDRKVRLQRHRFSHLPRVGWLYFPPNFAYQCRVEAGGAGNLSVRRNWAVEVGGMDAQFEKGAHREESDFCLRYTAKYGPLVFEPAASVIHLGASSGGCRTWGSNRGVHPVHHVIGEWYFVLKGLRSGLILWRDLPHHLGRLWARQIWNEDNRWRPGALCSAVARSIQGFSGAKKKLRQGPKHLLK